VTLKPASPESYAAAQAEFRELLASKEPWLANGAAALTVHDPGLLTYRGKKYLVPPVSYKLGQTINLLDRHYTRLEREIKRLEGEGKTAPQHPGAMVLWVEKAQTYQALSPLYRQGCRPRDLRERIRWLWTKDPFGDATEKEIEDLAQVFRAARTTSRVKLQGSIRAPQFLQWTWPPSVLPLSLNIPPRQRRILISKVPGSPAAGGITSRGPRR
jgi:hypothetical protein